MNVDELVTHYVAFRQTLGEKCKTIESILRAFCRAAGPQTPVAHIGAEAVSAFLDGRGPVTSGWFGRYRALKGFFRFAISRGHLAEAPLPKALPKPPPAFVPYIYTRGEIRRLLDAIEPSQDYRTLIEPHALRAILLLLYGAGLRVGEALTLTVGDVDLPNALITVRDSKFFKSRLVPIGPQLAGVLAEYARRRAAAHPGNDPGSRFFLGKRGAPIQVQTMDGTFERLRDLAGIRRPDDARYQPRLHDLRHSFAVHRLVRWYEQGADVQRLLHSLSVYLGHAHIRHTQVYLTMTADLLRQAGMRLSGMPAGRAIMPDASLLGPWVRRFLMEHLVGERNLACNTQRSYRDTLRLLLPNVAQGARQSVDRLAVTDLSAERVRYFLGELEEKRGCSIATRNQRLAAIHALARFIGLHAPELVEWCGQVQAVPFKKAPKSLVTYLEKAEMDALLATPDLTTTQGHRDHVLLLFLYNSGARADEAAQVLIGDLQLGLKPEHDPSAVLIRGKGNKLRRCPLWARTVSALTVLVHGRAEKEHVFLNRRGEPLTRFGIHSMVERHAARVAEKMPSVATKRVSPHTIRHTTATHLLRAGVDINTIRAWLGHVSLATTNVYAEVDLEMKAKALASCEVQEEGLPQKPWREDKGLMEFLRTL